MIEQNLKKSSKVSQSRHIQRLKYISTRERRMLMALFIFIISAVLAQAPEISRLEIGIFNFVYGWPDFLHPIFITVTQLGGVGMFLAVSFVYLFKRHYTVAARLLMSGTLAYLLAGFAKNLIGRPRPPELINDVFYREDFVSGAGFPSGHSALIMAIGLVLYRYLPKKYKFLASLMIIVVVTSRLYLGVHAPLDIVGGLAIGWFSVELFRLVKVSDVRS